VITPEELGPSVFPARHPFTGGHPHAAVGGRENGLGGFAVGTSIDPKGRYRQLSKAVQSLLAREPDVALAVLEEAAGDVARETRGGAEAVCLAIFHVVQSDAIGAYPDSSLTVFEQFVGFDDIVGKSPGRIVRASN
jgi:hypothetical protein